ncbi:MAG TPA: hypothetical protein VGW75_10305 [Solirubrobacteraceae bacterium]|nr:hypothetical protein [Solirubrobacteraceae bacterium]
MTRWTRTILAGTLLEVSFEQAEADPPQGLDLAVDKGRLAWDEQGEEARSVRVWADRHGAAVLRLTGRFARATLSATHVWLDSDEVDGDVVRPGSAIRVEERPDGALLRCRGSRPGATFGDLVARIGVHGRTRGGARAQPPPAPADH